MSLDHSSPEKIRNQRLSSDPSRNNVLTLVPTPPQYGHHMHDFDDEMNGIITTIASNSNRAKRRKEANAANATAAAAANSPPVEIALAPSSPSGSEPRLEAPPPAPPRHWCLTVLAVLRKVLQRAMNCCHVENPHYIDNYSRVTFPLSFVMVNLLYWTYYLYF